MVKSMEAVWQNTGCIRIQEWNLDLFQVPCSAFSKCKSAYMTLKCVVSFSSGCLFVDDDNLARALHVL